MLRVVDFSEAKDPQVYFDKVWEGHLFGTRSEQQRRQGPDVEKARKRAKITRKLKAISVESKRRIVGDIFYRDLSIADAPTLSLAQSEHELLTKTMEEAEWMPEHADVAFEVIDWIGAAEKKDE
jgi:hypothetical protein